MIRGSHLAVPLSAAFWSACALAGDPVTGLGSAMSGGKPSLDLRARYESVSQDNALQDADAYTTRLRLGYTTLAWNQLDASAEYQGTVYMGDEQYNSTRNGNAAYSVVNDPHGNELSQAWVRWSGLPDTAIKYGRSRLILDNARFIGNSGWRQNEQTFDGAFLTSTLLPRTTFNYAFLTDANNVALLTVRLHAHLVNAAVAVTPWLNLSAYDYLVDFTQNTAARRDTQTPGLRATGSVPAGAGQVAYALEYARQLSYADSPGSVKAGYELAELGYGAYGVNGKLGYEVLGSNDGLYGFQTPLASLHPFQGWADQFLATPANGIRDAYASASGPVLGAGLTVAYHQFDADAGGAHYGDETDLQAVYPAKGTLQFGIKYAAYKADSFSVTTDKAWSWVEYRFQS